MYPLWSCDLLILHFWEDPRPGWPLTFLHGLLWAWDTPEGTFSLKRLSKSMLCPLEFSLANHGPSQYKIELGCFWGFFNCFFFNWGGVSRSSWPPTPYITLDELLILLSFCARITELSPVYAVLGSNPGLYACLARADHPSYVSSSSQSLLICLFLGALCSPWL